MGFNVGMSDARALIKSYDADGDGILHNIEFFFLVISATDLRLRERFMTPVPALEPVGDHSNLGAGAEMQLANLMMTEICGLRMIEREQGYLVANRQVTSVVAYSLIKAPESNEVTKESLKGFLRENGYKEVSMEDIEGLFFRLDHNRDGKVTYSDFIKIYDDSSSQQIEMEPTYRSE